MITLQYKNEKMLKSDINPMPEFFDRYINLVEEEDLFDAFYKSQYVLEHLDIDTLHQIDRKIYAPNKWTIHDILQHIIDNERIQSYRALWFARNATTVVLPGYDEDFFAANANTKDRDLDEIIDELRVLRTSTIQLFHSFEKQSLLNIGTCSNIKISVLALGFMMVGHQIHHLNVIKERYEPLVK